MPDPWVKNSVSMAFQHMASPFPSKSITSAVLPQPDKPGGDDFVVSEAEENSVPRAPLETEEILVADE